MKSRRTIVLGIATCFVIGFNCIAAQTADNHPAVAAINWKNSLKQKPVWYGSDEAVRIADNLLLYQRDNGGWPKNIDMASVLTDPEKAALIKQKQDPDSTIDNSATYTQLAFLARVYTARKLDRHREAFLKGVDYLLKAQYANGGWPQYYPLRKGYYTHITFNDDAMIGAMELLRDISDKKTEYAFVDDDRRVKAQKAVQKGIELILKTQVVVHGERTVWGQQYDETTLAPAWARKFEPPCLTSSESVEIVRFLMSIDHPSLQVVDAVESAVAWFKKSELKGIKWTEEPDKSVPGGFNHVIVKDPTAGPLWARFYELDTNRPIFLGRDSVIRYDVSQIEAERRNGYAWYVTSPAKLLDHDYPLWRQKHSLTRTRSERRRLISTGSLSDLVDLSA